MRPEVYRAHAGAPSILKLVPNEQVTLAINRSPYHKVFVINTIFVLGTLLATCCAVNLWWLRQIVVKNLLDTWRQFLMQAIWMRSPEGILSIHGSSIIFIDHLRRSQVRVRCRDQWSLSLCPRDCNIIIIVRKGQRYWFNGWSNFCQYFNGSSNV